MTWLLVLAVLGVDDTEHDDTTPEPVVRIPQQRGRHHPPGWSR